MHILLYDSIVNYKISLKHAGMFEKLSQLKDQYLQSLT